MNNFTYVENEFFVDAIPLHKIAEQYGTPCYVYSRHALETAWHAFNNAFNHTPHRICYAVKSNSNLTILNCLARLGSGFDIVSLGELERVIKAGGDPRKIVFSGVGKSDIEIAHAMEIGIHCFNVESEAELQHINTIAKQKQLIATIALRVNPNIDAGTHPYIATGMQENKFGLEMTRVEEICQQLRQLKNLKLIGIACHIGSQITELSPFRDAIDHVLELAKTIHSHGFKLQHINLGGGLGVAYQQETLPTIAAYVQQICNKFSAHDFEIIIEPGRAIIANAGILLTQVKYLKHTPYKNFAIVDAGMNDLIRPALYNAWQKILPATIKHDTEEKLYDVVGPVCESADFLGKDRLLRIQEKDLLVICHAGAYGFSMSSNYNSRPRAAEILVDHDKHHLIRKRETIADLFAHEEIPFL